MELQVVKVQEVKVAHQVQQVLVDYLVHLGLLVPEGNQGTKEFQDHQVRQVPGVNLDPLDLQALLEPEVKWDLRDLLVLLVGLDHVDNQGHLDHQVQEVIRVIEEMLGSGEMQEIQAVQAHKAKEVKVDHQEHLVKMEELDHQVHLAKEVNLD